MSRRSAARRAEYPDDWEKTSLQLREAAGWQCEVCWVRDGPGGRRLAVDHVDGNTANNRRSNLIVLCSRCHCIKGNIGRVRPFRDRAKVIELLQARMNQTRMEF